MDENYPETCKDAQAILDCLGFETAYDDVGNLHLVAYDNKMGQEDLFLKSIATNTVGKLIGLVKMVKLGQPSSWVIPSLIPSLQ